MCLASRYPEAVALRRVDAETVAEAMMEIFSRTGLPEEILTDQVSVFMGRLTKQLCRLLDVKWLRTSPYHPQRDGYLERWHGSLKNMLRKCNESKKEWDNILKYFLFAYRSAPHANTGFSQFVVVLGRPVRGPLDVVEEGWLSGEMDQKIVVEWVDQLGEKLIEMREVVVEREKVAKESMKALFDKKAQSRELEVGMLVLVRTPNLSRKLDDLWDGPFKITRKISSVTYELAVTDRRSVRRMAHINMLKAWNPPDALLLGMVVVAEEEDEGQEQGKLLAELPALMGRQNDEVGALLAECNDVVRQEVGRARDICHEIDTGNEKPIRTCPYRLAPAWRDQLREEVRVLQESGRVVPSTSPWSSPMVPV